MSKESVLEQAKQSFLSVIKWSSLHAGARVVFDIDNGCPKANIEKKIIHMPRRVALSKTDCTLGILIHSGTLT